MFIDGELSNAIEMLIDENANPRLLFTRSETQVDSERTASQLAMATPMMPAVQLGAWNPWCNALGKFQP